MEGPGRAQRAAGAPGPAPRAEARCRYGGGRRSFEVVPVAGLGLGVVATSDFACGDLVVAERPVMAFSWGEEDRVEEMFDGLPEEDKEVVMSLHDQFVDGSGQADGQRSLDGVMRTNGYRTGDGFVLLTLLSRFNHSCSPNCEHSFDGDLSEMHVYASTDIAAGEELRTYWMELAAPTDERLALLREELGFTCRCPACVRSGAAAAASDGRRRRLRYLQECLEDLRVEGADADVERGLSSKKNKTA
ncbi:unnamed protein product [Prorocentrum cordatum]|uniref:SET domain-containing protein n=1 Tax=Prorocentrum cordatum TaxID=2364126 RepID=A0ABN9SP07_9DINO|nr:unnamed protein product [Polarella glacialis]